jgi:putative transposase
MPRRPRIVIPGVAHHVTQRGNNRQQVFFSDADFQLYRELIAKNTIRFGVSVLGYCLMPNHVHLVVVPQADESLARTFAAAHSAYALAVNASAARSGHLWQNRFFSCPMDESHTLRALRYVELNPVRAGLARAALDWPWSSTRAHTLDDAADSVLDATWREWFGGWDATAWREWLGEGDPEFFDAARRSTRTGEPLGAPAFVADLERRQKRRLRVWAPGRPRKSGRDDEGQECLVGG